MSLAISWLLPAIDAIVAAAFFAMAAAVIHFMRMRRGAPLNRVYGLLAAAIGMAGTAHAAMLVGRLTGAGPGWLPALGLEALAAVAVAVILFTVLPRSVDPPGRAALLRAKVALERAEALAHFGSWQWDLARNRVEWSPELYRIYGLAPGAFEGTLEGYLARVHPDDRARVRAIVEGAFREKRAFAMRERIVRPDGEIRILESAGDVVLDEHGGVAGMFGACHDITDEQRSEERRLETEARRSVIEQQFFQSQKLEAVGRLAGGIAHDFNNMLQVISGSAALLLDGRSPTDPAWADLKAIENAADRAGSLTSQLLAVARRQVLTAARIDVNSVVRDMEDMLRRSLNDDVQFEIDLAQEPLVVQVDPSQLHQVLLNLAVNARDAMPQGGRLTVATRGGRAGDGREVACIDVTDTGVGMDADTLKHTFEPFFTTKGPEGTGLGLATVYGIVTQSGGSVDVKSGPGEGTTFSICLPRVDADPQPAAPPVPAAVEGGSETLLLVDDSEPVLALTGRILSRAGYEVITAPSGEWALSVAARHPAPIDLLITDVMMPGMSGPQLAERLARIRPGLRVMYMTGFQRAAPDGTSMVPEGATVIEKPFKPDALLRQVRQVLTET
ncbi:MAG TPA: ATP-binding protein [Vicinamibacterales bacterium]